MSLQMGDTDAAVLNNAQYLATASDLAYLADAEGREAYRSTLGLETAGLLSVGNTQGYVLSDDGNIVVAMRGSERPTSIDGLKDWLLTNANNFLVLPEGRIGTDFAAAGVGARFHRGFMNALADIWDPLCAGVEAELKKKERPLWVTGHSLGGALALLAAWRFEQKFLSVHRVFTYGAPMVGNETAVAAIDKAFEGRIFRFVDMPDVVPHLPTVSLVANDYKHCQREMLLGAAAAAEAAAEHLKGLAAAGGGLLDGNVMDRIWACVQERLGAHDITNYRNLIGNKIKDLS
jgi:hypothetical protein